MPSIGVIKVKKGIEYIDLVPYGCTQLRLTVFPQLKARDGRDSDK